MPVERKPERRSDWEPTFDDYRTAREVMIHVRKFLETQGEKHKLSDDPVFGWIVLQSSPIVDPELFAGSRLASAEGHYTRSREVWREKNRRQA
jgi:hypothetical protein